MPLKALCGAGDGAFVVSSQSAGRAEAGCAVGREECGQVSRKGGEGRECMLWFFTIAPIGPTSERELVVIPCDTLAGAATSASER